jgi:hypothetical protein
MEAIVKGNKGTFGNHLIQQHSPGCLFQWRLAVKFRFNEFTWALISAALVEII